MALMAPYLNIVATPYIFHSAFFLVKARKVATYLKIGAMQMWFQYTRKVTRPMLRTIVQYLSLVWS